VEGGQTSTLPSPHSTRLRSLQALGIFCGFAAGAWLGGAEAPIKLVNPDISPITVSLIMVCGVFLARWSVPAFIRGTAYLNADIRQAPHLIVWAILAGCMWAVANTLTIYAIRNVGLSIAFPLWNTNSLLGIFWGFLLFNELHYAGWKRWLGVIGGAICMFAGATLLAIASSHEAAPGKASFGVLAALGAGILWGTMYIPYRKAYLTGMNPLSFITFFTIGELMTMLLLALGYRGPSPLWSELVSARPVLFWLMLGGFVWVLGDLVSAIRYEVCRHQPWHSAFEHEPAVGTSLGNSGLPRITWWWSHRLRGGWRRIAAYGGGSRRYRALIGDGARTFLVAGCRAARR
jgi:drug/metabolite transporter (DMT)-like permease